jgi:hypothetical protein
MDEIKLQYIETSRQVADIFTKPLQRPIFELLRDQLVKDVTKIDAHYLNSLYIDA